MEQGNRGSPDAKPLPLNLERLEPGGGGGCPQSGIQTVQCSSNPVECSQAEVTSPRTLGLWGESTGFPVSAQEGASKAGGRRLG